MAKPVIAFGPVMTDASSSSRMEGERLQNFIRNPSARATAIAGDRREADHRVLVLDGERFARRLARAGDCRDACHPSVQSVCGVCRLGALAGVPLEDKSTAFVNSRRR